MLIGACSPSAGPALSVITANADGLRTYTVVHEVDGVVLTCGLHNVEPHVIGVFAGDPMGDPERSWLRIDDGRQLSVVWPEGFTLTFEPDATLRNEIDQVVARAGDRIALDQVSPDSAAGTLDDPYIASCHVFGRVYVYLRTLPAFEGSG
jgi:hypothetical protein